MDLCGICWRWMAEGAAAVQVEAVFMPDMRKDARRQTICISTQAGCAVDCNFCLTAVLGLKRNLSAGEIIGQVLVALDDQREHLLPQTNVVLMGQGEPLLNFDAVMAAVRILLDRKVCALRRSMSHFQLRESCRESSIWRQEKVRPKLAISLNASNDAQRDAIMPINRKYPLAVLLDACKIIRLARGNGSLLNMFCLADLMTRPKTPDAWRSCSPIFRQR